MSYCVFPQVFFIVAACLTYLYLRNKSKLDNQPQKFANTCSILLIIYASVLLYLALAGRGDLNVRSLNFTPFRSYYSVLTIYNTFDMLEQIFENILVFIPLGILFPEALGLRGKCFAAPLTVAAGAFLSFVIELGQYTYAIGYTEFDDLFNNTLGCAVGCGIYCFADKLSADKNGIYIKKGWLKGMLPAIITAVAALLIILYREFILYRLLG